MNISQNKNRVLAPLFVAAFLLSLLATASLRAGTITLVSLPATGTDAATGITNANTYLCCLAFGSSANVTINGVPFQAVHPTGVAPPVSGTDTTHGGTYVLNANHNLNSTSNGNAPTQANGNTEAMLVDVIFVQSSAPVGSDLDQTYGGLTVGAQYALRLYYRQWTSPDNRSINVYFNGEGTSTNQGYSGNPFNESAGGANYIEYDFTAASTSVNVYMTNLVANESVMVSGMSLQETAPPVVNVAPTISGQPVGFTNFAGQNSLLSVSASGSPAPVYQWYQNNSPLSGATNAILNFSPLDPTNAGSYYVTVTNVAGAVTSSVVSGGVLSPITEEPGSVTATNGQTATFWVNAVGATGYQWYSNSAIVSGATSAVYTTPNLTMAANNSTYSVTVTTLDGPTNSTTAILTVEPATALPTVFSVTESTNAMTTNIVVVYSEAVSAATALNAANYSLNGVAPSSAVAGSQANVVLLIPAMSLSTNTANFLTIQHVQDLFGNTIVTTNIMVFPVNMSLWLRADVGVLKDINGNVVEWLDQTANANNATQYSGGPSARPAPQANQMNGQPALFFNAANTNYLQVATSPSVAITGDITMYAVANFSDYAAAREILGKTKVNIPAPNDFYVSSATAGATLYRGNGTVYGHFTATSVPSLGTQHVLAVMTMAGTNVSHFLDGAAAGTGILNNSLTASEITDAGLPLDIGSRNDLAQLMNGQIAEVMIFSDALAPLDRTNIDNYLGAKYFPLTISQQPVPVTTNQGVTATFSVAASQGSAHLTYQWQSNSVIIPSATNSSYTTALLTPNNNGDMYTVEIIVPGSSTNLSSPAAVTVNEVPPTVLSAGTAVWSQSVIVVLFSEAVNPSTATNPNNYSISPSGSVLSAAIGDAPNKVILTTSPLTPGTMYSVTVQNVMDLFGNTIVTASSQIGLYPTTLALWLEGNEGVTVDGNGYVTEWDDQSGNANDLYQPGGDIYAPLLVANGVTNAINGIPAPLFNGSSDYMYANEASTLAITGDMSVFAVMNFNSLNGSNTNNSTIISKANNNLADPYDYYVTSGAVKLYRGNGTTYGVVNSTRAPSVGVAHVLDVNMQGTTVTHRLDGTLNGSGTLSTAIADNGSYFFIGSRVDSENYLNGQLAELIVLGAAADSNDTASIEGYLAAKYGILFGSAPTLSVAQSAGNVILSWPTPNIAFALESTPSLSQSAWTVVTNSVVNSGTNSTVTLPAAGTQMFYRLQEQ